VGLGFGLQTLGWHTFRHTYRSLLDAVGAPIGVQQKLMRHAQVSTTMNIYGDAQMESKREANSKVVRMVLRNRGTMSVNSNVGLRGVERSATTLAQNG